MAAPPSDGLNSGGLKLLRVTELYGKRTPTSTYVGLAGFTPDLLVYQHNYSENLKRLRRSLGAPQKSVRQDAASRVLDELGSRPGSVFRGPLLRSLLTDQPTRLRVNSILSWDSETTDKALEELAAAVPVKEWVPVPISRFAYTEVRSPRAGYRNVYRSEVPGSRRFARALRALSAVAECIRALRISTRYLGPLRAEPRVVSPTGGALRSLPVGARGEYTADLLAHDKQKRVRFSDWKDSRLEAVLPGAVSLWASYLGIGDSVDVLDQGKLGRGLRVVVNGVGRDLTTIGVGASQVLPVLAIVLGAAPGSLILLEQPELHLHPAVQSRLADFFLFARPDVHLLVETHSEYLITRTRLRVAQGRAHSSDVDVLFAEQMKGLTSFRPLRLSELGNFIEWPAGFFDAHEQDATELVLAIRDRLTEGES